MIVVDTNLVAYLLIPGEHTDSARGALARDPEWAAPLLLRSELRNVLALYLRQGHLDLDDAIAVQHAGEAMVAGREYAIDSSVVLGLVAGSGLSAYDCEFVALARALDRPLVTADKRLRKAFPETTVPLAEFAASP